jgi:hypothetical protein
MFGHFYNESIRKLVVAFGSMFNDIRIESVNSAGQTEETRLPLSYGPKEKYMRRIEEQSSISNSGKVLITLPRLGFNITNMTYDSTRKRNTLQKRRTTPSGASGGIMSYAYSEVPYNFEFSLYGFVRNMNDALQISEQILPYFTPEFNVTMNFNDLNKTVDIPIVLNSVSMEEDYEGDFETRRSIITQFDFTVKSYVFGKIRKSAPILYTETTVFELDRLTENYLRSGPTGAMSRVDVGVSGASFGTASATGFTFSDYTTYSNLYTIGPSGSTFADTYIDTYGNTYAGATVNPPN